VSWSITLALGCQLRFSTADKVLWENLEVWHGKADMRRLNALHLLGWTHRGLDASTPHGEGQDRTKPHSGLLYLQRHNNLTNSPTTKGKAVMVETAPYVGQRLSLKKQTCTVRYIGPVADKNGEWLGVEWDDASRGKHDGTHNGTSYFRCRSRIS